MRFLRLRGQLTVVAGLKHGRHTHACFIITFMNLNVNNSDVKFSFYDK